MKKLFYSLLFIAAAYGLQAQQLYFEVSSGYNLTAYEGASYSNSAGFVPIRTRLAGGLEHVQVGLEYSTDITRPEFNFADDSGTLIARQEFENSYYGIFVRGNLSSLPAYRFGVVLSAGAGFYNTEPRQFDLVNEVTIDKKDFLNIEQALGYNFRIGISSPIYTFLHWEIGYQFNYVNFEKDVDDVLLEMPFQPYYHSFQAGLSLNLVFGNVEKKCRRVMSGNRSKRGW